MFHAMLENATRVCEAKFGTLLLREGDAFRSVALHNAPLAYAEEWIERSCYPSRMRPLGRVAQTKRRSTSPIFRAEPVYLDGDPQARQLADTAGARIDSACARCSRRTS